MVHLQLKQRKVTGFFAGPIETQFERYTAGVAIEARWLADGIILSSLNEQKQNLLSCGQTIRLPEYGKNETNWHPRLFIMNTNVDPDDQHIQYSLRRDRKTGGLCIREHRLVKGFFFSPFDFHYFPHDIQELCISFGSSIAGTKIELEADSEIASGINRQAFIGLQEWILFEHVESRIRKLKGYIFQTDEDGELDMPGHEKERTVLTISCHAGKGSKERTARVQRFHYSSSIAIYVLEWILDKFYNDDYWLCCIFNHGRVK